MTSIAIRDIQRVVATEHGIEFRDLVGNSRKREYAEPRQTAMALIRDLTSRSLTEIGRAFCGRHHTTVMHAIISDRSRRAKCRDRSACYRKMIAELENYQPALFHRHGSINPAFKSRRAKLVSGAEQ